MIMTILQKQLIKSRMLRLYDETIKMIFNDSDPKDVINYTKTEIETVFEGENSEPAKPEKQKKQKK